MTTQMSFDPGALHGWLRARRAEGITLPVDVGIPGSVDVTRLLRITARIGVRTAGRFALKQRGVLGRLIRPLGYRPDRLLVGLAPMLADSEAGVRGLHVFTFNQVQATASWRGRFLASIG
jgi:methylenetetrahydrofolate reductase (NADPH)